MKQIGDYIYELGPTGWVCVGKVLDGFDGPYVEWYE